MFRFEKFQVDRALQPYVQYYFVIDLRSGEGRKEEHFMTNHPQGTVDLMFGLNGGIRLANFRDEKVSLHNIFLMAQQEGFFSIDFQADSYIIGVVFYAEGFNKLFNLPMAEIKNTGVGVDDQLSDDYHELHANLRNSITEKGMVMQMDEFLKKQLAKVNYEFDHFDKLIQFIRNSKGNIPISDLAYEANMSMRTLQRKMKDVTGVGAKSYSNVMRFKEVLKLIHASKEIDWQDILFKSGYFDQAHFIRDFKRYTGKTPTTFVQDELNLSNFFLEED